MVRHAGAAPAPCLWKRRVLAVTPMTLLKMVAASGIAPDSPRLQRGADLSQLYSQWSLRAECVARQRLRTKRGAHFAGRWQRQLRRGLSLIGRGLCF